MRRKLVVIVSDLVSSVLLGLGIAVLLLPAILSAWGGVDNDAYVVLAEVTGQNPVVLAQFGLEPVWVAVLLVWSALSVSIGFGIRWLFGSARQQES